jgi:cytochrome c556
VAAGGILARLKVAFEQTRDVCNACHKEFRKK